MFLMISIRHSLVWSSPAGSLFIGNPIQHPDSGSVPVFCLFFFHDGQSRHGVHPFMILPFNLPIKQIAELSHDIRCYAHVLFSSAMLLTHSLVKSLFFQGWNALTSPKEADHPLPTPLAFSARSSSCHVIG